jgi:hypothetical protein
MQAYSNPEREHDTWALPDLEIFELTAREIAERDEDMIHEFMKRPEYRLAAFNGRARDAMFQEMIDENCIEGGWFYWYCFPGCMPDSDAIGPYVSAQAARQAAQDDASD